MASQDLDELIKKTKAVALRTKVTEQVLQTVHVMTDQRIFRDGIAADGGLIGVYSEGYQRMRRAKNYPISRKVILQATGQMINDYKFFVLADGNYGSGFSNNVNYLKSLEVEKIYNKSIFELTKSEEKKMEQMLEEAAQKYADKL